MFHRALLTWNFQKGYQGFKIEDLLDDDVAQYDEDLAWSTRSFNKLTLISDL